MSEEEQATCTVGSTVFEQVHTGRQYGYSYTGAKWRCTVCRKIGYGEPSDPHRWGSHWSHACARGHAPCAWCGKMLALKLDGTPRIHTRCKERPEEILDARDAARAVAEAARSAMRGPLTPEVEAVLARLTNGDLTP